MRAERLSIDDLMAAARNEGIERFARSDWPYSRPTGALVLHPGRQVRSDRPAGGGLAALRPVEVCIVGSGLAVVDQYIYVVAGYS